MITIPLTGWSLHAGADTPLGLEGPVEARVPGCVHADLLRHGLLPDPYMDTNEKDQLWIGRTPWRYTTSLPELDPIKEGERIDLVCEGLDTVAEIFLDDTSVAQVANMHRSYRWDVTSLARGGAPLRIDFAAPLPEAERRSEELGPRPNTEAHPFNALRKMACSFGWDWNIKTMTSGIWRPIRLERWQTARLARVLLEATPTDKGGPTGIGGQLTARVDLERLSPDPLEVIVRIGGVEQRASIAGDQLEARVEVNLDSVDLWWPTGHGEQPLYGVEVVLESQGRQLDRVDRRVGFRSVELDTSVDGSGGDQTSAQMTFIVNGRPIMVRGVNWIPDDALLQVDRDRLAERLHQALDANCNLIRVWGGGVFASDDLAELCDELGLMLWQDCLLACGMYSEDEPLRSEIEAEVTQNLARLGHHPSLVLINGNNENLWAFLDWGWSDQLGGRTWGAHYYYEMFPRLVAEVVPSVPYTPGSPWSPDHPEVSDDTGPNDPRWGSVHLWKQWNELPATTFRDVRPRFVAEFGWQSFPGWSTLDAYVHDDPRAVDSPAMANKQKAGRGVAKMTRGLEELTGVPHDFEAWHWASQYVQADAVRTSIGWFRSLEPHCTGTVWWQLNDSWPVASWALIDWCGVRKPAWYALKEVYSPRLLTIQPDGGQLWVTALNDTDEVWAEELTLSLLSTEGTTIRSTSASCEVPPRGRARVMVDQTLTEAGPDRVLMAEVAGTRAWWWFQAPKDRHLPAASAQVRVVGEDEQGMDVELQAATLLVDATLLLDKLDPAAWPDQAMITLLPGESHTLRLHGLSGASAEDLLSVLVSANDFGAHTSR